MATNKEYQEQLTSINTRLQELGDLKQIIDNNNDLYQLGSELKNRKIKLDKSLEKIPQFEEDVKKLINEASELKIQFSSKDKEALTLINKLNELENKVNELKKETEVQLGKAANSKLANSFEIVKEELQGEKNVWFTWLIKSVIALVIVTLGVVTWQVYFEKQTLYSWSFLIKLALGSPLVYFIIFVNREFSRSRVLIEEYAFKASIARSFEAYKDIIESAFSKYNPKLYQIKIGFLINSIGDLYTSPMKNVKNNRILEKENTPDIFERIKSFFSNNSELKEEKVFEEEEISEPKEQ